MITQSPSRPVLAAKVCAATVPMAPGWWLRWCLFALLLIGSSPMVAYEVSLRGIITTAEEKTGAEIGRNATCVLELDQESNSPLEVQLAVQPGVNVTTADYDIEWLNIAGGGAGAWTDLELSTGEVTFISGQRSISIRIKPLNDTLVERAEELTLVIVASPTLAYTTGANSGQTFMIADDDHRGTIIIKRAIADENTALAGDPDDPISRRRAIVQVLFDEFANTPAYATRNDFPRSLSVVVGDIRDSEPDAAKKSLLFNATRGSDYDIKMKIGGHNNPATVTDTHSQLGLMSNTSSNVATTTGINYRLMAALAGENTVPLKEQEADDNSTNVIPGGTVFYFESDPTKRPYTSVGDALSAITFNPALDRPIPSGTKIKITSVGGGGSAPDSVEVEATYPAGSTVLKVGGGFGRLYEGDVISIAGDDLFYVIVEDPADLPLDANGRRSAEIEIFAFEGGNSGGIFVEQTSDAAVTTLLTPRFVDGGTTMQILVPEISRKVEFSIEPNGLGDGAEGVEHVYLQMISDNDYIISTPTTAAVKVVDRDVVAGVSVITPAQLPNIPGAFRFHFTKPFDRDIDIVFELTSTQLDNLGVPLGIDAEGESFEPIGFSQGARKVTVRKGETFFDLQIKPIAGGPPASLRVDLGGASDDFRTGGSGGSGTNPSATMVINESVGSATIVATDSTAIEGSSNTGLFTITITRPGSSQPQVPLKLGVGGTAVSGRFELFNPLNSSAYTVLGGFVQGVEIPLGANSVTIGVRAAEDITADGSSSVQLTLNGQGTNYVVGTPASAVVSIQDNEPVVGIQVVSNAVRPSTAGSFRISFPGVPVGTALAQKVTLNYTFSGATLGTDFDAPTVLEIPAGSPDRQADLIINPTATGTATSVTVTLTASGAYHINPAAASATMNFVAEEDIDPSRDKPTPGTVGSSSGSGGGCGLGSGAATLAGLLLALGLLIGLRRRVP